MTGERVSCNSFTIGVFNNLGSRIKPFWMTEQVNILGESIRYDTGSIKRSS